MLCAGPAAFGAAEGGDERDAVPGFGEALEDMARGAGQIRPCRAISSPSGICRRAGEMPSRSSAARAAVHRSRSAGLVAAHHVGQAPCGLRRCSSTSSTRRFPPPAAERRAAVVTSPLLAAAALLLLAGRVPSRGRSGRSSWPPGFRTHRRPPRFDELACDGQTCLVLLKRRQELLSVCVKGRNSCACCSAVAFPQAGVLTQP